MTEIKMNNYLHTKKINPTYKYGFRAECVSDIIEFQINLRTNKLHKFNGWNFNYTMDINFPDIDCELEIDLEIDKVRKIMGLQLDSHVMIESIDYYDNYTGERYFNLP